MTEEDKFIPERYYSEMSQKAAEFNVDNYYQSFEYPSNTKRIISNSEDLFFCGAEWQRNNLWIPVEEGLPDIDKQCFVITKNGKCSVSNMYIPKDCYGNVLGEKEWKGSQSFKDSIVAWMPIPEIKKGE